MMKPATRSKGILEVGKLDSKDPGAERVGIEQSGSLESWIREVLEPGDPGFEALLSRFPRYPGTRSIIRMSVTRIADSCGFGVPLYRFEGERTQLMAWAERKGEKGLREYQLENNRVSVDGLPALRGEKL